MLNILQKCFFTTHAHFLTQPREWGLDRFGKWVFIKNKTRSANWEKKHIDFKKKIILIDLDRKKIKIYFF